MSHEGIRFISLEEQARNAAAAHSLPREAVTPQKVRVLLTEGKGLEIDWSDGHKSAWGFKWLRDACPCATCNEARVASGLQPGESQPKAAQLLPMYTPPSKPRQVTPIGRYAIQFDWEDGHLAGIYSWDYLRRNCQCPVCKQKS